MVNKMETFKEKLQKIQSLVKGELEQLVPEESSPLEKSMRYVLSAGKRLRPFIFLEICDMFANQNIDALKVAAAIECLHNYTLVHDDLPCMDNDDYRRGRPSCHKQFNEETAVLTGDALLTFSFEILSSKLKNTTPEICCKLMAILATAAGYQGLCLGQSYDLECEKNNLQKTGTRAETINRLKTGALFSATAEMALVFCNCSEEDKEIVLGAIADFGILFQLKDDLEDNEILEEHVVEVKERIATLAESAKDKWLSLKNRDVGNMVGLIDFCCIK